MRDFYKLLIDYNGNHYRLAIAASKRAYHIVRSNILGISSSKPAVRALYEILSGEIDIVDEPREVTKEEGSVL